MNGNDRGRARCAALLLALLGAGVFVQGGLVPERARATVMVEVPLEDMVRDADAIVLGVVEHVGVRLRIDEHGSVPHTIATIRVREWIKGGGDGGAGDGGARVRVDEIGGVLPEAQLGMAIAGTPRYGVGDEVVVFLRRIEGEGAFRTYAMEQGHFVVQRGVPGTDDVVARDLGTIGLASWASGPMRVEHGGRAAMRLADFLGYLRSTLEQLRVPAGTTGATEGGAR